MSREVQASERHIRDARRWGYGLVAIALLLFTARLLVELRREIVAPRGNMIVASAKHRLPD